MISPFVLAIEIRIKGLIYYGVDKSLLEQQDCGTTSIIFIMRKIGSILPGVSGSCSTLAVILHIFKFVLCRLKCFINISSLMGCSKGTMLLQ